MRELIDAERLQRFIRAAGRAADTDGTCYFAGGATAVGIGWRASTVDLDVKLDPEQDALMRALPAIKEELRINVELASPADFIPVPSGWEDRSPFVARERRLTFRHFDLYAQALSKIERGHARDSEDVRAMIERGLVEPHRLRELFDEIRPQLYRFPAVDERSFAAAVERATT
jgi:hypothetical protein